MPITFGAVGDYGDQLKSSDAVGDSEEIGMIGVDCFSKEVDGYQRKEIRSSHERHPTADLIISHQTGRSAPFHSRTNPGHEPSHYVG